MTDNCLLPNCGGTHTCVGYSSHCQDSLPTKANGGRGVMPDSEFVDMGHRFKKHEVRA